MTDVEPNFSVQDLDRIQPVFTTFFILVQLALMAGLIWMGWRGAVWYLVISVGAALWVGVRVVKRMFRNQFSELMPEAQEREAVEEAIETRAFGTDVEEARAEALQAFSTRSDNEPRRAMPDFGTVFTGFALLATGLLPAALWYGVGIGLRRLFG